MVLIQEDFMGMRKFPYTAPVQTARAQNNLLTTNPIYDYEWFGFGVTDNKQSMTQISNDGKAQGDGIKTAMGGEGGGRRRKSGRRKIT